jgi:hypothetical protein
VRLAGRDALVLRERPREIVGFEVDLAHSIAVQLNTHLLNYDGVPWNNNNAEHAIKAFGRLRQVISGTSTKKGVEEYLTLLSVSETCEFSGIDFQFTTLQPSARAGFVGDKVWPEQRGEDAFLRYDLEQIYVEDVSGKKQ